MKISALQEYGLRCLVQLAREGAGPDSDSALSTREIAEREGLTVEYAAQILASLRRTGLVKSSRGVHGGYRLTAPPSDVSVGRLFRALDGPIADSICESYTGKRDACMHQGACDVAPIWTELARRIYAFLDGISLADITAGAAVPPPVIPLAAVTRRERG